MPIPKDEPIYCTSCGWILARLNFALICTNNVCARYGDRSGPRATNPTVRTKTIPPEDSEGSE